MPIVLTPASAIEISLNSDAVGPFICGFGAIVSNHGIGTRERFCATHRSVESAPSSLGAGLLSSIAFVSPPLTGMAESGPSRSGNGSPPSPSPQLANHPAARPAASILLVEDNPGDVLLVREALAEHQVDCELVVLHDGDLAMAYIEELEASRIPCPALAILDLNVPKKNGRQVLERLRRSPACGQIPVVILSSSDAPSDREETARLGASCYIRKPTQLEKFLEIGGKLKTFLNPGQVT